MKSVQAEIARQRLLNLGLVKSSEPDAAAVVRRLGALQAQDYAGVLWSVGLRWPGATSVQVEEALATAEVVRTWPMRGTLHLIPAEDAHWMLRLLTRRPLAAAAARQAQLGIDAELLARCRRLLEDWLGDGQPQRREDLLKRLEQAGIATEGQRGYHLLVWFAQHGLICLGPMQGKQQTFVLLDAWVRRSRSLSDAEGLAELAGRFFRSHGPATVADFARWTGLSLSLARQGLAAHQADLCEQRFEEQTYWSGSPPAGPAKGVLLLPGFDEYLLGYKDRSAVLRPEWAERICPGHNGMFSPTLVVDGQVMGTWRRRSRARGLELEIQPFGQAPPQRALTAASEVVGAFWQQPVHTSVA